MRNYPRSSTLLLTVTLCIAMSLQFRTAAQTTTSKGSSAAQIDRQVSLEPLSIDKSATPSPRVTARVSRFTKSKEPAP